ncbi:hypothetical protein KEM52_006670 [Ascosphaera acerosa]|nr:hypothetical protein KEM52_006670 [Ascosphaera acerosa]
MKFFAKFETRFAENPDTLAQNISAYQFRSAQIKKHEQKLRAEEKVTEPAKDDPTALKSALANVPHARPFDCARLARFAIWPLIMAPLQLRWYAVLARMFPAVGTATTGPAIKRVAVDQLFFSPISLAAFFSFLTLSEGGSTAAIKQKLSEVYFPTLKANYMVWPMVQVVNFSLIPTPFQIPFCSTIGIAWTVFLSLTNSSKDEE